MHIPYLLCFDVKHPVHTRISTISIGRPPDFWTVNSNLLWSFQCFSQKRWTSWNWSSLASIHKTNNNFAFLKKWYGLETILSFWCPAWWEMVSFREVILFGWHPGRLVPSNFFDHRKLQDIEKTPCFLWKIRGWLGYSLYFEGHAETTVPPKRC